MKAVVIYESLTGNTAKAGQLIAEELTAYGIETSACPINQVNLPALSEADLVIVGAWTDGLVFAGQKPGRDWRLRKMPVIDGKRAAVYCTYAVKHGKTLPKLERIVRMRGGEMIGGYAIHRNKMQEGVTEFVGRVLSALDAPADSAPADRAPADEATAD